MLPMSAEAQCLSFLGAVLILGPKAPSPVSGLRGVRRNYVKLVKGAAAHWRAARGERAVFDSEWSPRMGVEKMHTLVGREGSPFVFGRARTAS